jgi:hypothetical protein
MGGGMPMGGMAGGGGQQGGDSEHKAQWRMQGQLFDEPVGGARLGDVIGEEPRDAQ